jgi:protein-S-isoprenylcysteine O-methyltransferase
MLVYEFGKAYRLISLPHDRYGQFMNLPSLPILGAIFGMSELVLNIVKRSKAGAISKDRHTLALIWLVNMAGAGIAVFLCFKLPAWSWPWREQLYSIGFGVFVIGIALRWYSIIYLGRFFTTNVAIARDHRLIDSGPYRHLRHPSYTGSMLMIIGFGLCLGNIPALLVILISFWVTLLRRIQVEEQALTETFGDQYQAYKKRTRRLIPFIY